MSRVSSTDWTVVHTSADHRFPLHDLDISQQTRFLTCMMQLMSPGGSRTQNLHDQGHLSGVGSVLHRSRTAYHNGRSGSRWSRALICLSDLPSSRYSVPRAACDVGRSCSIFHSGVLTHASYYKMKKTSAVRSKISSKLIFASCVG